MLTPGSLIFLVDDDISYGKMIRNHLMKQHYNNVVYFEDDAFCLLNMDKNPEILITDYHLKNMDGINLINKAKEINHDFYSILLSGLYQYETFYRDDNLRQVDMFITKGENELKKLISILDNLSNPLLFNHYY